MKPHPESAQTAREIELQRIADELNDTSPECLAAVDELAIIRLERDNARLQAENAALLAIVRGLLADIGAGRMLTSNRTEAARAAIRDTEQATPESLSAKAARLGFKPHGEEPHLP